MKITFILPYAGLAGGIRVVAIYAELLQQRGHTVTVVSTPKQPITFMQKIKSGIKGQGWPSSTPGPSHFDNLDVDHQVLEQYRPIVNKDVPDADVVIATWWETAEWIIKFLPEKGVKYYFVQHHEIHKGQPIKRVQATYKLPLHKITISNWLVDIMKNEYGDENVSLIPNSVDHTFFTVVPRGKQTKPTVGFMLSPSHYKGCDIIVEALQIAKKTIPELKILAFGAQPPQQDLPLPADTDFYFQPSQEKIREIYSSCDFWLFGSRVEGFGLPLSEAMACRTPVIASRAGAAPDLICPNNGILLKKLDPITMAQVIIEAFAMSDSKWESMSAKARATVVEFSWNDATDLFEKELQIKRTHQST